MTLRAVDLHLLKLPLTVPYHLAFGDVTDFDTIVVEALDDDDRAGYGEATLLAAYGGETLEDAWSFSRSLAENLIGRTTADAKETLAGSLHDHPFSVTAFTAAIEMLEGHSILSPAAEIRVPLLGAVNATDHDAIPGEVERLLAEGYGTLKVKVGFDIDDDLDRLRVIQEAVAGRAALRLDGNQGYTAEDGCRFAAEADPEGIELFEQPCAADDWAAAAAVAKVARVPMMLDESIFGLEDIERAADLGIASFIKLKLLKMGGLDRLADALELIRAKGMEPVLGNGVASDIACWMEAAVAAQHIRNAGEFNGFLRPVSGILAEPLAVDSGAMVLTPDFVPELDRGKIARFSVAGERAGATAVAVGPLAQ